MYSIEALKLTKKYKDVTAVDELELGILEGELFSLLGVNGAGKTTAIRMLSCLTQPTSGTAGQRRNKEDNCHISTADGCRARSYGKGKP